MNTAPIENASCMKPDAIPELSFDTFKSELSSSILAGAVLPALFCVKDGNAAFLYALLKGNAASKLVLAKTRLDGNSYPSLTPEIPQAHMFEREIFEQYGIKPEGHPWLKPVRFEKSRVKETPLPEAPVLANEYRVEGEAIHEVAVGPVHAGVIEPGHFRFQCSGERVHHLEISLGFQHRGIEKRLPAAGKKTVHFIETLSGDSTISHTTCFCRLMEALTDTAPSPRAEAIRALAAELERIANHVGDLGALAGDVAFLPTAAYCGRVRGEFLNMTALICGNRFGRNLIRQGGVRADITTEKAAKLLEWFNRAYADAVSALDLMFDAPTVLDRFENTGTVSFDDAVKIGMVGVAARASGMICDIRSDFPTGYYRKHSPKKARQNDGDVLSRAKIRFTEIKESAKTIREILSSEFSGAENGAMRQSAANTKPCRPSSIAVSLEEGWRGEICHIALTDENGKLSYYKVVDPSFHNWFGLALALREQEISDFPICNKSFNLSYCGHDL